MTLFWSLRLVASAFPLSYVFNVPLIDVYGSIVAHLA